MRLVGFAVTFAVGEFSLDAFTQQSAQGKKLYADGGGAPGQMPGDGLHPPALTITQRQERPGFRLELSKAFGEEMCLTASNSGSSVAARSNCCTTTCRRYFCLFGARRRIFSNSARSWCRAMLLSHAKKLV